LFYICALLVVGCFFIFSTIPADEVCLNYGGPS
jgi:hypothetical protein